MEDSEPATRRMNRIAGHINAIQQSSCNPSLATLVCSAGSVIRPGSRKDSRLLYARQGSQTQAFYMRESIESQVMLPVEKENSAPQQVHHTIDGYGVMNLPLKTKGDPLFSKPSSDCKDAKEYGDLSSDEGPLFSRSVHDSDDKAPALEPIHEKKNSIDKNNVEWLPRMDIAESRAAYDVTVELPGVNAEGIRVEVNNDRLLVSGTRLTNHDQEALYHRRELPQGPYRVVWPIPEDSNTDFISAEFIDGFLRIHVPKLTL